MALCLYFSSETYTYATLRDQCKLLGYFKIFIDDLLLSYFLLLNRIFRGVKKQVYQPWQIRSRAS